MLSSSKDSEVRGRQTTEGWRIDTLPTLLITAIRESVKIEWSSVVVTMCSHDIAFEGEQDEKRRQLRHG